MSCYSPSRAFPIEVNPSGKPKYFLQPLEVNHIELRNGKWCGVNSESRSSYAEKVVSKEKSILVPCGRCIGCRLDYSKQWADRCLLELQYHDSSYFITLTYDDEHMPLSDYVDKETGELKVSKTLVKKDFQDFMKRLRKNSGQELRFFMCGEYGTHTKRPHYHAIIFGLKLDDLVFYKRTGNGDNLYNSPFIDKTWNKGYCVIGDVTWESCAYTSRYITKKIYGTQSLVYDELNIIPEFTLMSRKPGIANQYYQENKDKLYKFDHISIKTENGGKKIRPGRYFDKLYAKDFPEDMETIKNFRKEVSEQSQMFKLDKTDLDINEYLKVEEQNKNSCIKSLCRKEI